MTEFYTIKRIDNSRLVRPAAPNRAREICRRVMWGAALAGCVLFYALQHFQGIQLCYRLEELQASRTRATELNQQLRIEVATLHAPMRIEAIARQRLGLSVPAPGQVAPVEGPSEAVLAQMRSAAQPAKP